MRKVKLIASLRWIRRPPYRASMQFNHVRQSLVVVFNGQEQTVETFITSGECKGR